MAIASRTDPYLAYRFRVEIEGLVVGGFSEVTGLDIDLELVSYREGGLNAYAHLLPGATRYPSRLVLKRGLTDADGLWRWYRDVARGKVERRSGSIILLNASGDEAWRWNVIEACPVRWAGPQLSANASTEVAVEVVELVHRGITKG